MGRSSAHVIQGISPGLNIHDSVVSEYGLACVHPFRMQVIPPCRANAIKGLKHGVSGLVQQHFAVRSQSNIQQLAVAQSSQVRDIALFHGAHNKVIQVRHVLVIKIHVNLLSAHLLRDVSQCVHELLS